MKNETIPLCIALYVCATLISILGCDAMTAVHGIVLDAEQHPIAGASVRLAALKGGRVNETRTNQDGSFSLEAIHGPFPGAFVLEVSQPGYALYKTNIEAKTRQQLKVVLVREQSAEPPAR